MLRTQSRYLLRSIASSTVRASSTTRVALPSLYRQSVKFYSTKDNNNATDKKQQEEAPKSILNDEMLARAGFEDVDPKEKSSSAEGEDAATSDKRSERKRKRAQTSKDLQREKYANFFYLSTFALGLGGLAYMSRDWDSEKGTRRHGW